jgi:uncharacterized RDD family membrane protein YckC
MMTAERLPLALVLRRGLAYVLDCALLAALVVASQFGLRALQGSRFPVLETGAQLEAWVLLSVSLPVWLYFAVGESSTRQATPAKRLLGLRVVSLGGEHVGFGQALRRTLVKLLPWELTHVTLLLPTPIWSSPTPELRPGLWLVYGLLAAYVLCAALTPRRQAPHDLIAGTLVVPAPTYKGN